VSFNLAYIGMVKTAGSEANILYTAIPQTLSGLVGGITQLFGAMASDPTLGAAFPNLVAAALGGPTALRFCRRNKLADVECAVSGRCRRFHGHDSRGYADYGHDDIGGDVYDLGASRAALERIPDSYLVDLRSERVSSVSWTRSWPTI
jgi:hypothetical protein